MTKEIKRGKEKATGVVTSCAEADEHHGKDDHGDQHRKQLMAEERAPAPLLLHLLSVLCRVSLLSLSLSTEQAHVLLSGTYTKRASSFTSAVRATHLDPFIFEMNRQDRELHIILIKKHSS
ncbi:hypothetical protein C2845_PMPSC052029 [Panicum miliaceum]|uniref:Uncharacterized protein n=1 Tax=Panicum miliaceum TaxID=4540 RepID=A0A3L6P9J9_PANMI|nr:hypothetical protein C2845_PMPSC052029 [Panicum miliaceum]